MTTKTFQQLIDERQAEVYAELLDAAKAALVYVADQTGEGTNGIVDKCEVHRKLVAAIARAEGWKP